MRGIAKLAWVQAKLFVREPSALFFTLVFPTLLLIVFGFIFGNEPLTQWGLEVGYIDIQVPALAAIIIGSVALIGIPIAISTERELGVLRRYRATPLRPLTFMAAQVAVNFLMCLFGMLLLVALGVVVYGLRFRGSAPEVLGAFTLSALAFFAVGYLVASLAPSARVAQTVGMVLFFPLMFLSGAAMPRQIMPERVQAFADWLPLTQVVRFLQALWAGESFSSHGAELLWLAGMLLVGTVASARLFRWE